MLSINKYREASVRYSSCSSLSFSLYFFLLLVQRYKIFSTAQSRIGTNVDLAGLEEAKTHGLLYAVLCYTTFSLHFSDSFMPIFKHTMSSCDLIS